LVCPLTVVHPLAELDDFEFTKSVATSAIESAMGADEIALANGLLLGV
jgi:hypothetical protein